MSDLISRKAALDAIQARADMELADVNHYYLMGFQEAAEAVESVPDAQPGFDEWCTDCKEYDQENHCCPRWNRVIREALKDAQPEERTNERTETHACDSISRQAAIDAVRHAWAKGLEPTQFLEELPSAQPERKKGRWYLEHHVWFCDQCEKKYVQGTDELFNFCPNCGADMRGEQDEET